MHARADFCRRKRRDFRFQPDHLRACGRIGPRAARAAERHERAQRVHLLRAMPVRQVAQRVRADDHVNFLRSLRAQRPERIERIGFAGAVDLHARDREAPRGRQLRHAQPVFGRRPLRRFVRRVAVGHEDHFIRRKRRLRPRRHFQMPQVDRVERSPQHADSFAHRLFLSAFCFQYILFGAFFQGTRGRQGGR